MRTQELDRIYKGLKYPCNAEWVCCHENLGSVHILDYIVGYRPPLGLKLGHWKDKTHISNFTEDHLVNRCCFRHDYEATSCFEFGNTFCQPDLR